MKYASDLLYSLARGAEAVSLDGKEQEIEVPSVLLPTVLVVGAQRRLGGFVRTAAQRDSFIIELKSGKAASQAATSPTICTFGKGIWDVEVLTSQLADFSQLTNGSVAENVVELLDPSNAGFMILKTYAVALVPVTARAHFRWLFTEDGWYILHRLQATGVAQTLELNTTVAAARLL